MTASILATATCSLDDTGEAIGGNENLLYDNDSYVSFLKNGVFNL